MNYNRAYNNNRQDFSNRPPQQYGGRGGGMVGGGAYRSQAGYGGGGGRFNNSSVPDNGLGYGNGGQSIQEMTLRLNPGWLDEGEDIEVAIAQLKAKKAAELAAAKSELVAAAVPQPAVIPAQAPSAPIEKPSVSVEKPVNAGVTSGFGLPKTTTSSQSPSIGFGNKQEWVKVNGAVETPHSAQPPNSSLANGFGVNNGTSAHPSVAASGIATAPPNGMVAGIPEPTVRYRQSGWIDQDKDLEQAKKAAELAAAKSEPVATVVPQPPVISTQTPSMPVEKPSAPVDKPVNEGVTLIESELGAAPVIHINIGPETVESGNDVHLTQQGSRLIPRIVISSETPLGLNNSVGLKGGENGESKIDGQTVPFDGGLLSGFSKEDACAIASISQKFFEAYSEMNEFVQRICARQ